MTSSISKLQWFTNARYGQFIHFGPYAHYGRGEQVLFREFLDQREYEKSACAWNPQDFDATRSAQIAKDGGAKYAVFTTRHHDGYCLWDTATTNYSSVQQAPQRDFIGEYMEAYRAAGLRVGLYYSLLDWRLPAYWKGPDKDPQGWNKYVDYIHAQVRELMTQYGKIDVVWFDGAWPWMAHQWKSPELLAMMQQMQPDIITNDRLGVPDYSAHEKAPNANHPTLGDFGTPEQHITAENRAWESCQVSTWRSWGNTTGERWRPAEVLLDMLCEAASKGGNLLLNVGPNADGSLPTEYIQRMHQIGQWLDVYGEAIYGTQAGNITEFVKWGWQTVKGNDLYLIIRFWHPGDAVRLLGLDNEVRSAVLLGTNQQLTVKRSQNVTILEGLPLQAPTDLFPVIRVECDSPPRQGNLAKQRLWAADPEYFAEWASQRGDQFDVR